MKVICVDDENIMLQSMLRICKEIPELRDVQGFEDSQKADAYIERETVDLAFLDVDMPKIDGLTLGKHLKSVNPAAIIIFVTGYSEYMLEAFRMHAFGYLLKPVNKEDVLAELENLKAIAKAASQNVQGTTRLAEGNHNQGLRVRTFGNFEVFMNGIPVEFERNKTKELMAYLIDREGAACSNNEIAAILWEDDENHLSYLKKLCADLVKTLKEIGCGDAVIKTWGNIAIVPDKLSCDYYDWKKNQPEAIRAFNGEYMTQYSWAEGRGCAEWWKYKES